MKSVSELAKELGYTSQGVTNAIRDGRIVAKKLGGWVWVIEDSEFERVSKAVKDSKTEAEKA